MISTQMGRRTVWFRQIHLVAFKAASTATVDAEHCFSAELTLAEARDTEYESLV